MKKVFTTGQVAKICKVAPRTVSKWFDSGRLKGYRIPGSRRTVASPANNSSGSSRNTACRWGNSKKKNWHKVLLIGTEKMFNDRIKEIDAGKRRFQVRTRPAAASRPGCSLGNFHPDTIIIDLGLGRSESVQITGNLRKNEAYTATLIIGLAGEDEAEPEKLKEYGFGDVFKKPFDVALLGERIRTIAEAKRED